MRVKQIGSMLLVLLAMGISMQAVAGSPAVGRVAGLWEIKGMPDNGIPFAEFNNLASIDRRGQLVNIDPDLGGGVGEVYRIGPNKYTAGIFGFINEGGPVLRYEVQATLKLTGPVTFSGRFRTILTDLDGNVVGSYEGDVGGTRLTAQPY